MRIGGNIGLAILGAAIATMAATSTMGAEPLKRVQPVPIGGSTSEQSGEQYFGIYVPTKFGGQLTITTTDGNVDKLTGPDGKPRINGQEIGENVHGWYTFAVTGATKPYQVSNTFIQVGQSARKPWNYYYWPTKSDAIHEPWAGGNARVDTMRVFGDDLLVATPGGYIAPGQDIVRAGPNGIVETPVAAGDDLTWFPNMYDDLTFRGKDGTVYSTPSPMLKYDQVFNSSARNWEAANSQNQDISRWPGHCLGGAVASILLNEPEPAPGSGLTKDELKALWAELGENHYNHKIGDFATASCHGSTKCSKPTVGERSKPSSVTSGPSRPEAPTTRFGITASASTPRSTPRSQARETAPSSWRWNSPPTRDRPSMARTPTPA